MQGSAHDLSKMASQAKMSVLSAVCTTFVSGRNRRKRQRNQATFLLKRCLKTHPRGSGISNRPLACDFGQIVRRHLLQQPGRKCPLSDRGTRKPTVSFRPRPAYLKPRTRQRGGACSLPKSLCRGASRPLGYPPPHIPAQTTAPANPRNPPGSPPPPPRSV